MKIVYIATGAANMYCGSCMNDNTLASAMKAAGIDVTMLPLYTPMRLDEPNVSDDHVFYGGIEAYLLQRYPQPSFWRDALLRFAGNQLFLKMLTYFDIGSAVDPSQNADLTISMLQGKDGRQNQLLQEMIDWIEAEMQPDLVHITNSLISGVAGELKRRLKVPLVCGLHGEDIFLDGLPPSHRQKAIDQLRQNADHIDHFIAISQYYLDIFGRGQVELDPAKLSLVKPGISLSDYRQEKPNSTNSRPPTIGYLARISPEKGLHVLVEAFILLVQSDEFPDLRLRAAGYLSRAYANYVDGIRHRVDQAGLSERVEIVGTVDRQQKIDFLHSLDVFSVPTIYRDPKGIPVLEALASGVPVVQPNHGAFPERVGDTEGGLLHTPEDPRDLAEKLAELLRQPDRGHSVGQQGRQRVFAEFNAERMASETIHIYERLLA